MTADEALPCEPSVSHVHGDEVVFLSAFGENCFLLNERSILVTVAEVLLFRFLQILPLRCSSQVSCFFFFSWDRLWSFQPASVFSDPPAIRF
jgi:hypothetical protein